MLRAKLPVDFKKVVVTKEGTDTVITVPLNVPADKLEVNVTNTALVIRVHNTGPEPTK